VQRARDDAAKFEEALRSFGYHDGTVSISIGGIPLTDPTLPDTIDKAQAAPPLQVVVAIDTGRRYRIGQITIEGAVPPDLVPSIGIAAVNDALAADVLAARDRLLAALREAHHPLATVAVPPAILHRERQELDVIFQVVTGRPRPGSIRFNGLRDMSEAFMRERLLVPAGPPFSPSSIEAAREDLLTLGVFSAVRMVPADQLDAAGHFAAGRRRRGT